MCIYIYIYIQIPYCVEIAYESPLLPSNNASGEFLHKSGAICLLDIFHLGAGLSVTGRIRDNGQKVLQF